MTAAVVLAAGASERMGRPKALLPLGNTTFLGAILATLQAAGVVTVRVVLGARSEAIAGAASMPPEAVVRNPAWRSGMLSSVRAGLDALPPAAEAFLIWPVDHPLVRPETVRALIAALRSTGAPLALPVHEGRRGHPVLFASRLAGSLRAAPESEGARAVVHAHLRDAAIVEVPDPGVAADIDTPEAYARFVGRPLPEATG